MENFSNNILLLNLIKIRWLAILGQLCAIILVFFYFEINIPVISCLCIVFISSITNIFSYLTNKNNIYLYDKEAFYFLLFDTIQLGILLYLTGGIYNPFSLLIIAPLIISASYLPIFYSICLLVLSICSVIFISNFYLPIEWNDFFIVPTYFKYGLSISLIISLIFLFIYVYFFANSSRKISKALSEARAALLNQKKISEIGSLSAAAVHELSTPLNTIFLILSDLKEDKYIKNNFNINKEVDLLRSQAERCKNILLTMSKNPENLKDTFLNKTTISDLIKVNFEKFNNKDIELKINLLLEENEPSIKMKDELVYGLGNIIQNAIQHTKSWVKVDIIWDKDIFKILIIDNGPGFKSEIFDQIGKPYIAKNNEGMGLGIFIAKNLLENIGGTLKFNNIKNSGANVEINIKRDN